MPIRCVYPSRWMRPRDLIGWRCISMATVELEIQAALNAALEQAIAAGELPPFEIPQIIPLERPKQDTMGDLATPLCMQLARMLHLPPLAIAQVVVRHLPPLPPSVRWRWSSLAISICVITRAGWSQVDEILLAPETYGQVEIGAGERVQVEYVSANPTGPLAHRRGTQRRAGRCHRARARRCGLCGTARILCK